MPLQIARPRPTSAAPVAAVVPTASSRPELKHRSSIFSQSSASWTSGLRRVRSITSGASTPLMGCLSSPDAVFKNQQEAQRLLLQLTAAGVHDSKTSPLKMYGLVREALQRSAVFGLFDDAAHAQNVLQERLRGLPRSALTAIIAACSDIQNFRQDGLGPAKTVHASTSLHILGLVAAARLLLGQEGCTAACLRAKENISCQQPLEKRFVVLLLAVSCALSPGPSDAPKDLVALRSYCKPAIERLNNNRSRQSAQPQLLKKIALFLTDKRAEKLPAASHPCLLPQDPLEEAVVLSTPSEAQYIHIDAKDCPPNEALAPDAPGPAQSPPKEAPERRAFITGWLSKIRLA